ncbi:hypothetical protein KYC5002_12085 [Archangium violaceum]|uniref:hypothetical protein n=1 Tax=Archangium violaceum TaxID=83451 RepID=UPI002B2A9E49|nr:hypothetical protein KYC5002_12085 [Archangium gephyra]
MTPLSRRVLPLTVVLCVALSGCSHIVYSRGAMSAEAANIDPDENPEGQPFDFSQRSVKADTQEIALLDSTGAVCASLMTAGDAMASAEGRRKQAERNREFGILTYKYRVTAPGEFGGYPCGVFVKWSTVNEYRGFQPGAEGQVPSFGEAGLMLSGWDEFLLPGLYFGGGTRPAVGFYSEASVPGSDDIYLRLPINLGFMIAPYWAGGLALRATAGFDIVGLALMAKSQPFQNGFWVPLDYGAYLSWTLPVFSYGSLTAMAGWGKEVQVNNNDLMFAQGQWLGQVSLVIDYGAIFSGKSANTGEKKM